MEHYITVYFEDEKEERYQSIKKAELSKFLKQNNTFQRILVVDPLNRSQVEIKN